jgi:phage gp29-like protein
MLTNTLINEYAERQLIKNYFINGIMPNPDKILSKTGKTIEAYRELKNDPHVWSCIQSRKSGVLSLDYLLDFNGADKSIVDFIELTLNSININKLIADILEAVLFGYQPLEIMWKFDSKGMKRLIPENISAKPQEWFYFDKNGNLMFKKNFKDGEKVPDFKFLIPRHEASYQNPYGEALLGKCYWSVTFKNGGVRFWVNYSEKYGMPLFLGQFQRGASMEEIKEFAAALAGMTQDTVIVSPNDFKVEIAESNKATSVELFRELIKHCNAEISKVLLSQTLTTELGSGSLAAAQTHFKIRKEVIRADSKLCESTINTLIDYIVKVNFGDMKAPKFRHIINESDNQERIDRDIKLVQAGIKLNKDYWAKTYGLKDEEFEVNV